MKLGRYLSNISLLFLLRKDTALKANELIPVGQEMYEAGMKRKPQPVVVAGDPRDGKKMKLLKELVCGMVVCDPSKRMRMRDVLKHLEAIDGG